MNFENALFLSACHSFYLQDIKVSFEYVDIYAKMALILYTLFGNSTTQRTIIYTFPSIIFALKKNHSSLDYNTNISISHAFNETWRHFALLHQCRSPPKKPQFFLHPLCFKFSLGFRLDLG